MIVRNWFEKKLCITLSLLCYCVFCFYLYKCLVLTFLHYSRKCRRLSEIKGHDTCVVWCLQCYDRLCQWDKMENVCHLMLSDSAANTRDVSMELVWQQTCNQVLVCCVCVRLCHNLWFSEVVSCQKMCSAGKIVKIKIYSCIFASC